MTTVYIIIGLVVLSVIIISHEFGHFVAAKLTGVRVEEFGIGYPPRLFKYQHGETIYSINAIPFGGFNKMTGEEDPSDPRSLAAKNRWARLLVITGGTLVNLILAFLLFSAVYLFPVDVLDGDVRIEGVSVNSPAEAAGLIVGDIIIKIENEPVRNNDILSTVITENLGKPITFEVLHQDETISLIEITPRTSPPPGEGSVGILTRVVDYIPVWQIFPRGFTEMWNYTSMWVEGLASIFSGDSPVSITGPVAIVQLTVEVAAFGVVPVLKLAAIISLVIGIMNMFPIPALDGSRVVFLLIEAVRGGKRLKPKIEGMIHFVGFALLVILLFIITYQDIVRIINGESLLG